MGCGTLGVTSPCTPSAGRALSTKAPRDSCESLSDSPAQNNLLKINLTQPNYTYLNPVQPNLVHLNPT